MIWNSLDKYRDAGLLLLRLGFGLFIAFGHGWGKIAGGPERWEQLGGTMELFGIAFLPTFWGFLSTVAEFFGGLLVAGGALFRPTLVLLVINMTVAALMHIITGQGSPEMALLFGIAFLSLFLTGAGSYSVDARIGGRKRVQQTA